MIFLLVLVVFVALDAAVALAFVRPLPRVARAARDEGVNLVRRGAPYAYTYVLGGSGSADDGDHDTDKLVVRVDRQGPVIVVRVAPVDRAGRRTGRSRIAYVTR